MKSGSTVSHAASIGLLAVVCVLVSATGCKGCKKGEEKKKPDAGAAGPSGPVFAPEPDGIRRYRHMVPAKDLLPIRAMDPKESTAVWHYRVEWKDNKVIRYERVSPSGVTTESVTVERRPDDSRVEHVKNAFGIEIYTDTVDRGAVATRVWRSGEQIYDGCHSRRRTFDSFGRMETDTCLDDKSQVALDANGCAITRYGWTQTNDVAAKTCFMSDMTPSFDTNGVHKIAYDRDLYGNVIEEAYFGPQNERLPLLSNGCLATQLKRDDTGNALEIICADEKHQSMFVRGAGYTTIQVTYDANGCATEHKFVDFEGKTPKKGLRGKSVFTVDNKCTILKEENTDPRNRKAAPVVPPWGFGMPQETMAFASEEREINADGVVVKRTCKGTSGPVACKAPQSRGAKGSIVTYELDERGRRVKELCFQAEGKPSACGNGIPYERRLEYGPDNRVAAETFFDEKGAPPKGWPARIETKWSSVGRVTQINYLDKDGQPMAFRGVGSLVFQFDLHQRLTLIQVQGTDGQPTAASGFSYATIAWPAGAAKMSIDRENEFKLADVFLGRDDKAVKRVECKERDVLCYRY